jgi:hypothetical protein
MGGKFIIILDIQRSLVKPDTFNRINQMLHLLDDISGNKLNKILSNVIQLSGRFIYLDDFPGNQSVWTNKVPLYM